MSVPVLQRITREREWAYSAWVSRLSWGAMRRAANLPESEGGLGYDLSESALKGLVLQAKADRGDMTLPRADRIERQSYEVDERARAATHDFRAAYARAKALDEAIERFEVYDVETAMILRGMISDRGAIAADLERADRRLDAVHARESKLHGLDAPTEARLEVTTRDAVVDELNEALAAAGLEQIAAHDPGR